jgi:type II secretory ATPase GspE/PulE/Tfp pilus assembly ATPase PilB-like protein
VKPIGDLWDSFGNFLKRSEQLYQNIISLVISAIVTHILLESNLGSTSLEQLYILIGSESSLIRFILWILLTCISTVMLARIFNRLRLRFRNKPLTATMVRMEDLSVSQDVMISMLPEYRTRLAALCSQSHPDVVKFVNELISAGFSLSASDIYLSPRQDSVSVTMRVHGQLYDLAELQTITYPQVINRIKVLSNLAIFMHNVPQDGHIRFEDRVYTARVSILPTSHGERTAIRLITSQSRVLDLDQVGMPPQLLETYKALLNRNQGMIILTGPTGSGKSTTMFASLLLIHRIRGESVNIVTLEDPIETDFEHFHQTQIDPLTQMTFARGLRSVLRQDPDVIMLGEIRDEETAENAMRAAMTGHLLLTTVHSSGTTGVFDRLTQMGIGSAQLSSTIHAVLSQRLCHCLCEDCRQEMSLTESHIRQLNLMGVEDVPEGPFFTADGCDSCLGKGYTDRMPLFEMLIITDQLRNMIATGEPSHHIYQEARKAGMQTLFDHGLSLSRQGSVSFVEVLRMASS